MIRPHFPLVDVADLALSMWPGQQALPVFAAPPGSRPQISCDPPNPPYGGSWAVTFIPGAPFVTSCLVLQAFVAGNQSIAPAQTGAGTWIVNRKHLSLPNRWAYVRAWYQTSGRARRAMPQPLRVPSAQPSFYPTPFDPFVPVPSVRPDPLPRPFRSIPGAVPSRWQSPSERSEWGYPYPLDASPKPSPLQGPIPRPREGDVPAVVIQASPALNYAPAVRLGVHRNRRPPRGTRERKLRLKVGSFAAAAMGLFGALTEGADVMEALWDAIPWRDKPTLWPGGPLRKVNMPQQKAAWIMQHLNAVNWNEFAKNIVKNQFEDWFYGQSGRALQMHYQHAGTFGNWFSRHVDRGPSPPNPVTEGFNRSLDAIWHSDADWKRRNGRRNGRS